MTSDGEARVLKNLQDKEAAAEEMFARLINNMNNHLTIKKTNDYNKGEEVPSWL